MNRPDLYLQFKMLHRMILENSARAKAHHELGEFVTEHVEGVRELKDSLVPQIRKALTCQQYPG